MVWFLHPTCKFREPQYGQPMPFGQRWPMNQDSAFASSGNFRKAALGLESFRCVCPGSFFVVSIPYTYNELDKIPENNKLNLLAYQSFIESCWRDRTRTFLP